MTPAQAEGDGAAELLVCRHTVSRARVDCDAHRYRATWCLVEKGYHGVYIVNGYHEMDDGRVQHALAHMASMATIHRILPLHQFGARGWG